LTNSTLQYSDLREQEQDWTFSTELGFLLLISTM